MRSTANIADVHKAFMQLRHLENGRFRFRRFEMEAPLNELAKLVDESSLVGKLLPQLRRFVDMPPKGMIGLDVDNNDFPNKGLRVICRGITRFRRDGLFRVTYISSKGSFEVPEARTAAVQIELHYALPTPGEPMLRAGLAGVEVAAIADLYEPPVDRDAHFTFVCGRGPSVVIDSTRIGYSATGTYGDLMDHRPVTLAPCGPSTIDLSDGDHRVAMNPSPRGMTIDQFVLGNEPTLSSSVAAPRSISLGQWGSTIRRATIGAGDENLFVVDEVFNRGWEARLGGVRLDALEIDGWRQAFVVPAGAGGELELTFTPNRPYQAGTAAGFGLLVLLVALAIIPRRRRDAFGPVGAGQWPKTLPAASGVVLAIWTIGVGAVLLPVLWFLRRRLTNLLPLIAFSAFTIAGALLLVAPDRGDMQARWLGPAALPVSALAALALICVITSLLIADDDSETP